MTVSFGDQDNETDNEEYRKYLFLYFLSLSPLSLFPPYSPFLGFLSLSPCLPRFSLFLSVSPFFLFLSFSPFLCSCDFSFPKFDVLSKREQSPGVDNLLTAAFWKNKWLKNLRVNFFSSCRKSRYPSFCGATCSLVYKTLVLNVISHSFSH